MYTKLQHQLIHQTQQDKTKFYQRLLKELELQMTPAHQHADNPNAKRILIVCDEGVNRSVTLKARLQYWGHDILTVGLNRNAETTIAHLAAHWAELIILTAEDQAIKLKRALRQANGPNGPTAFEQTKDRIVLWDIGEDIYPRPFNTALLTKVTALIDEHRDELAPAKEK